MSESEQNKQQNLNNETGENSSLDNNLETDFSKNLDIEKTPKNNHNLLDLENPIESLLEENQVISVEKNINLEEKEINFIKEDLANLQDKKEHLLSEIKFLEENKAKLSLENQQIQNSILNLIQEGLKELEQKKQTLEIAVQKLERRQERIKEEMRTTFAGVSQDLAIRVQGFKDYLVGSLQDLALAAEQLELPTTSFQTWETPSQPQPKTVDTNLNPQFAEKNFKEETREIRRLLDQYRTKPDYYGAPWQLRRTFEPIHAERAANWFFSQGGRGSIKSMGSRLQNILVASAIMSILANLYGDRSRTLLLVNTPERLGEWRRGLQDCLGISRSDFGPDKGVVLFETPENLSQKAERLLDDKELPLVIMDQTDDLVSLSLLQFPLWLAFAPESQSQSSGYW